MEGMFLINIKPWIAHNNLGEYANFLLKQHIHPHYLIFDDPEHDGLSPKFFERKHRDQHNLGRTLLFRIHYRHGNTTQVEGKSPEL